MSVGTLTADSATGSVGAVGGGSLQTSSLDLAYTPSDGASNNSLGVGGAGTVANIGSITFGSADDDQGSIDITDGGEHSTGSITLGNKAGAFNTIEIAGAGSTLNAPGGLNFVNGELELYDSASYTPPVGSLTLGAEDGSSGQIDVEGGGDLTIAGALVLGQAEESVGEIDVTNGGVMTVAGDVDLGENGYGILNEGDDGVISVDGDMSVDYGTLGITAGALNVSGDFSLGETASHRGNIYQTGGTIDVAGTASFGESSVVSDQFIVQSTPDDDIATFQAENIVFGSQSVTTGQMGSRSTPKSPMQTSRSRAF